MDALSDAEQEASPDSQASPGQQLQRVVVPILEKTLGEMTATRGDMPPPQDPNPSLGTAVHGSGTMVANHSASPLPADAPQHPALANVQETGAALRAGDRCIIVHRPVSPIPIAEEDRIHEEHKFCAIRRSPLSC